MKRVLTQTDLHDKLPEKESRLPSEAEILAYVVDVEARIKDDPTTAREATSPPQRAHRHAPAAGRLMAWRVPTSDLVCFLHVVMAFSDRVDGSWACVVETWNVPSRVGRKGADESPRKCVAEKMPQSFKHLFPFSTPGSSGSQRPRTIGSETRGGAAWKLVVWSNRLTQN